MTRFVSVDPHEENRKASIELLEEQLEAAKRGEVISVAIVTVQPDLQTTTHLATSGNQTLMVGALFTQMYRLASLGWDGE